MASPARPAPAADQPVTVSQLAARIDGALKAGLPQAVRVVGEVSGFANRTHWYFALKDAGAVVNCVMFASVAAKSAFTPRQGDQAICRGRVEFYAPSGRVSFVVDRIEPAGEGARELALRRLVEEARALGWLDPARKRPLPLMPACIAVVTSAGGAALQDVLVTLRKRFAGVHVLVADTRVQGEGAAADIASTIAHVASRARSLGVSAILVTRGGGSAEDLWAFNDRAVAAAIVNSPVPVVAAIGHETDVSLAELVADHRAATPTQAAMLLAPDAAGLRHQVESAVGRLTASARRIAGTRNDALLRAGRALHRAVLHAVQARASRLDRLRARLAARHPAAVHAAILSRVESARRALTTAMRARLAAAHEGVRLERLHRAASIGVARVAANLASTIKHLEGISPLRVLDRGYSVTVRSDGVVVRSAADVKPGDLIRTRLRDGHVASTVSGAPRAKRAPADHVPGPPGLFDAAGG